MRRVLVTGSRDWNDRKAVWLAIFSEYLDANSSDEFVVVHGDCPTGADRLAREWCEKNQNAVTEERHSANWDRACDESCYHKPRTKNGRPYCPMAGHLRNQEMVDLGADVCLAFPLSDSRGTRDCMKRAEAAGIPVVVFEMEPTR